MTNQQNSCPALVISAPNSGAGKTTVTAALARYHSQQGKCVRVFKIGPDFIDPMILEQASGHPVYQLDLWMVGKQACQQLLFEAAATADLILIESVMGLFDGTPNSAELAETFNIPILAVVDASAMAQSFGAVVYGLEHYHQALNFYGVIANKVASERHGEMVLAGVKGEHLQKGCIRRNHLMSVPERHLGITQAKELLNINEKLDAMAQTICTIGFEQLPPAVNFLPAEHSVSEEAQREKALAGTTIAIIRDNAFSFLYKANIQLLETCGATVVFCSALEDIALPQCDALYIPGGYPELYATSLAKNTPFIKSLNNLANQGKPILAECGGMMYLLDEIQDMEQQVHSMAGILPGKSQMQTKLAAVGQQYADFSNELTTNHCSNVRVKGHSFHYSTANITLEPITTSLYHAYQREGENIYWHNNILASYMHWYFPSNPEFFITFFTQGTK